MPFDGLFTGTKTYAKPKKKKRFEGLFQSRQTSTPSVTSAPTTAKFAAPPGGTKIGENKWRTPSGSIWEYEPDGTRIVRLAPQFGGGSYKINPDNPNEVVRSERDYAGVPSLTGHQRDHIIPVSLGGVSDSKTNIRSVPSFMNEADFETDLANKVKKGEISRTQALFQVMVRKQEQHNPLPSTDWQDHFLPSAGEVISKPFTKEPKSEGMVFKVGEGLNQQEKTKANLEIEKQSFLAKQEKEFKLKNRTANTYSDVKENLRAPIRALVAATQPDEVIEPLEQDYPTTFRFIYGDEPIIGYSRRAAEYEENFKQRGYGALSTPLAVAAATGEGSLELAPLYAPMIRAINDELAVIAKNTGAREIKFTFKDLQDITTSTSDEMAAMRVGRDKVDAFKAVGSDLDAKNLSKSTVVKTSDTPFQKATRPITQMGETAPTTYSVKGQTKPKPSFDPFAAPEPTKPKQITGKVENPFEVKPVKPLPAKKAAINPFESGKYRTIHEGGVIKMVDGEPIKVMDGVETFLHKGDGGWIISEVSTGRVIAESRSVEGVTAKAHVELSGKSKDEVLAAISKHKLPTPAPKTPVKQTPVTQETTPAPAKITKAAQDINKELVEKGLKALPENQLAKFDSIKKKDTIERISGMMATDEAKARAMATGETDFPGNFSNPDKQVLFNAIEEKAIQNKDYATLAKLASSPIATERSLAAQTLGASGFNKTQDSVVAQLQRVKKALEAKAGGSEKVAVQKRRLVKDMKKAAKEINLTKEEKQWEKFLDDIAC